MDTGASRSCINYTTFLKIRNPRSLTRSTPRVFTVDGSDLGSMGIVQLMLKLGDKEVTQDFVVFRQLKRDIILGADFGKQNCAGVEWLRLATFTVPQNEVQQRKYIETEGQNVSCRQIDESKLLTGLKLDKEVNQSHCDKIKGLMVGH